VFVSYKPLNTVVLTGLMSMVMSFLHAGRQRDPLRGKEEPMTTIDGITALFYQLDEYNTSDIF
jgi:hypothetical protein